MGFKVYFRLLFLVTALVLGLSAAAEGAVGQMQPDVLPGAVLAQDGAAQPAAEATAQAVVSDGKIGTPTSEALLADDRKIEAFKVQSEVTIRYSVLIIAASAAMLALFALMHAIGRATFDFSKHYIVLVVISCSILLLIMGYTEQQIAPAYGLLGTVLGYIFGRSIGEADARSTADAAAAARDTPDSRTIEPAPELPPSTSGPTAQPARSASQPPAPEQAVTS